jgi:hypothetical protein
MAAQLADSGSSSARRARRRVRGLVIAAAAAASVFGTPARAGATLVSKPLRTLAQHELLRPSDFPRGWKVTDKPAEKSTPSSTGGGPTKNLSKAAGCEGLSARGIEGNPPSAQITFAKSSTFQFVFETVAVFRSVRVAKRVLALYSSSEAPSCIGPTMGQNFASGTSQTGVTTSKITITRLRFRPVGSPSTALRLGIPLESNGAQAELMGDVVVIRSGSSVAIMVSVATQRLSSAFVRAIALKAAKRLR